MDVDEKARKAGSRERPDGQQEPQKSAVRARTRARLGLASHFLRALCFSEKATCTHASPSHTHTQTCTHAHARTHMHTRTQSSGHQMRKPD